MGKVCFTLDVLSDGSEFTGATIFLSVWKRPSNPNREESDWLKESMEMSSPLARYAISGLGDCIARLCADQRFKISPTRAVFLPSRQASEGLSSLLLALHTSGSASLHVVSSDVNAVEEIASTILGKHRNLNIMNCEIPKTKNDTWWNVYQDEYLIVHARKEGCSILFLYSLFLEEGKIHTIALIPALQDYWSIIEALEIEELPCIQGSRRLSIETVITLDADKSNLAKHSNRDINYYFTLSKRHEDFNTFQTDPGLLIRSQQLLKYFSQNMPWAFSFTEFGSIGTNEDHSLVLSSCTSIILDTKDYLFLDRRVDIMKRLINEEWSTTLESLKSFLPKPSPVVDENEIDLDEDDDETEDENEQESQSQIEPQVVVLGTGCASPSAVRGASGYALLMPAKAGQDGTEIYLLDAGEGVTAMLSRTCNHIDNWLNCIKGIWISHAHLDHYGGLPTLVREIWNARVKSQNKHRYSRIETKRQKQIPNQFDPPWVMAPFKVLFYLDVLLGCKHGVLDGTRLFVPLTHIDPTIPPGPWTWFQNIKVHHNCCPSYGLLIRLRYGGNWLCFSGDTRPCKQLVTACQQALRTESNGVSPGTLFLIHEATFEDKEQDQAEKKKHSTVGEALQIASEIPATRVLLTHFSQRYISIESKATMPTIPMGIAMDGLKVPLWK